MIKQAIFKNMTKLISTSKEVNKADSKKSINLKKDVLKANIQLIAFTTIKERKSAKEYLDLSLTECKQINALLIKKEKHYLPKGISEKEQKTYRSFNRSQFEKLDKFFLKGTFNKSEESIKYIQALRKFTLSHYNIDLKLIDAKTFDFSTIYSNKKHMDNLKNVLHLM